MKRRKWYLLCLIAVCLLAGCKGNKGTPVYGPGQSGMPTGTPTQVAQENLTPTPAPSPTNTPELTEAPQMSPTPTVTLAPTDTPIPTATPVPTDTPTPTNTPTPTATSTPTPSPTDTPTPTPAYTYKELGKKTLWATVNVNMRTLPSTAGEKIDLVYKGKSVVAIAQCNETGWYQVEYNGKTGFVCNDYLTAEKPATPTPTATPTPRVIEFTGDATINIKMVGDMLIHDGLYKQCKQSDGTYNADIFFKHVKDAIAEADIAIVNQETIFVADEADYGGYPNFGSPFAIGQAMLDAGFDVVAHATNHTVDKGISGIRQTLDFWRDKDITVLGIHETPEESDIDYLYCEGIKISFVNYTYGLNGQNEKIEEAPYIVDLLSDKQIEKTVAEAKATSDLMIAILHVGTEYVYTPSSSAQKQVDRFIDAGADIVLCAHPHVVETYGMRTTKNGNTALVYYSLGNFVSGQNKIPRMIGGMADITIGITYGDTNKVEILDYTMIPLVTHLGGGSKITTFFMEDYPEDLLAKHKYFKEEGLTKDDLFRLYQEMVSEADYLISRE